jgi:acetate kinase
MQKRASIEHLNKGHCMNILVLNYGSSTVKFQIIETDLNIIEKDADRALAWGVPKRIGSHA